MGLWKWIEKEWGLQKPHIRFEIYRVGAVALFGGAVVLVEKVLRSVVGIPDLYFYPVLFVICCVMFGLTIYRLKESGGQSKPEQVRSQEPAPKRGISFLLPMFSVLLLLAIGVWNVKLQLRIGHLEKDAVGPERVKHLEIEMLRYVFPRQLTKDQTNKFGDYLSTHSKPHEVTVKFLLGDEEAAGYASDFVRAFAAANWLPKLMPINPTTVRCERTASKSLIPVTCIADVPLAEGVNLAVQDEPNEKLSKILEDAMKSAGIQIGGLQTGGPSETSVTLSVGHRRRDRFAILPPGYLATLRQHRPTLENLTDDDY